MASIFNLLCQSVLSKESVRVVEPRLQQPGQAIGTRRIQDGAQSPEVLHGQVGSHVSEEQLQMGEEEFHKRLRGHVLIQLAQTLMFC